LVSADGSILKILVVDDEPRLAQSVARLLESQGHQTTLAFDGLEAWSLFEGAPEGWDMLITDIRMPKLDGVNLARRVRAHGSGIPVLFISGHGELPNVNELSPASFVAKPFKRVALLAAIEPLVA
jgi:DNA-binding response OmpR family regulator